MSRPLLSLLLCVSLVSFVSADCKGELSALIPTGIKLFVDASNGDTAQFETDLTNAIPSIEAAGQACTGFTPTTQCNTDITNLQPDFNKIIDDIAADNVSQLEKDIAATADSFNTAVTDCTGFVVSTTCSSDLLSLIGPGASVVDDIRDDHLGKLDTDLDAFLPYARSAIEDCTGNAIDDTCQNDINNLVPSIVSIIYDLEAANYAQLISDLDTAVPRIELAVSDCLGHQVTQQCEADLVALIPDGLKIFQDIQDKNWSQLDKDLEAAQPLIDTAWSACIAGTSSTEENLKENICWQKLERTIPYLTEIYMDYKFDDTEDVWKAAQSGNSYFQEALYVCN